MDKPLDNYAIGGYFPPIRPRVIEEDKIGHIDVVVFALNAMNAIEYTGHGEDVALRLQGDRGLKGVVYSYSACNREYFKCFKFFNVQPPAYVVITYEIFQKYFRPVINEIRPLNKNDEIVYARIYEGTFRETSPDIRSDEVLGMVLYRIDEFYNKGKKAAYIPDFDIGIINKDRINLLYRPADNYESTQIKVLFANPVENFSDFELKIRDAFKNIDANTKDVHVKLLYENYLSEEYKKCLKDNAIIKLPAAVFEHLDKIVLKMERDTFEDIFETDNNIDNVISDICRAIELGRQALAKEIIDNIRGKAREESLSSPTNNIEPFPTPPGTIWEDVEIKVINADEVLVRVGNGKYKNVKCEEMGMKNKRFDKPTVAWELLVEFTNKNGVIQNDHFDETSTLRQFQYLKERLREYFQIDGDPFEKVTDKVTVWKPVFSLKSMWMDAEKWQIEHDEYKD